MRGIEINGRPRYLEEHTKGLEFEVSFSGRVANQVVYCLNG